MLESNGSISSSELRLAAAVQEALLTGDIPECECGKMVLKNRMCGLVGGDFYHFRQLGQSQVAFAIGDVVGHGVPASLIMTLIMGYLRADQQNCRRPSKLVSNINDQLVRLGARLNYPITCSLIYGVVDLPSGILLFINAGHPQPIIFNRGDEKTLQLPPTTLLLGVQSGVLSESCYQFRQQDRLVLFTDGIIEAQNDKSEFFSRDRLLQIVCQAKMGPPENLAERVFNETSIFLGSTDPKDDQTFVVIDFDKVKENI